MAEKFKPIFERTLAEQAALMHPRIIQIQKHNLEQGLYNSFRDSRYSDHDTFVRQYSNRQEVVRVNAVTGNTTVIQVIK